MPSANGGATAESEAAPEAEEASEAAEPGIEDDFDEDATVVMADPSAEAVAEAEVVEEE